MDAPRRVETLIHNLRVVGPGTEAHLTDGGDKELAPRVYVSHPIVDVFHGCQVARVPEQRFSFREGEDIYWRGLERGGEAWRHRLAKDDRRRKHRQPNRQQSQCRSHTTKPWPQKRMV